VNYRNIQLGGSTVTAVTSNYGESFTYSIELPTYMGLGDVYNTFDYDVSIGDGSRLLVKTSASDEYFTNYRDLLRDGGFTLVSEWSLAQNKFALFQTYSQSVWVQLLSYD
jgi:hypothetical protein